MPDIVTCPSCNTTLRPKTPVAAGTRIKCPKCQTVFAVPGDEEAVAPAAPPPAAASARPPDADDGGDFGAMGDAGAGGPDVRRPAKKGVPLWVWLVGGAGVLVLVCCGGCGVLSFMAPSMFGIKQGAESAAVSAANYDRIQKGMTEAQVKAIMGEPTLQGGLAGIKSEIWKSGEDSITVGFQNDKVIQRQMNILGTTKQGW